MDEDKSKVSMSEVLKKLKNLSIRNFEKLVNVHWAENLIETDVV